VFCPPSGAANLLSRPVARGKGAGRNSDMIGGHVRCSVWTEAGRHVAPSQHGRKIAPAGGFALVGQSTFARVGVESCKGVVRSCAIVCPLPSRSSHCSSP
jgi:hypothetical protein